MHSKSTSSVVTPASFNLQHWYAMRFQNIKGACLRVKPSHFAHLVRAVMVSAVLAYTPLQAQPLGTDPWVGDIAISTGLQVSSSAPTVRQPNNEYRESNIDLRVAALGGPIDIARSWSQGRWWLNPAWGPLNFELDPLGGTPNVIERAGLLYERSGSDSLFISSANSYAPVYIRKTTSNAYSGTGEGWQWYDRLGNTIDYDKDGRILGYANPSGIKVSFAYDSANQIRILDHLDQVAYTLTLENGLITKVADRAGRSVSYSWSGSGDNRRLAQVTDVAGETWQYQYNSDGQITKRIDPLGEAAGDTITVQYASSVVAPPAQLTLGSKGQTYDPSGSSGTTKKLKNIWGAGRVAQLTNSRGQDTASTQYLKESRQFLVNETDYRGNSIQVTYDLAGFELKRTFNGKTTNTRQWDGNFHAAVTNARGLTTKYDYDHNRQITKTIHPDGSQESSQYNDKGLRTRYTNELGIVSTWDYDSAGRVTKQVEALGTPEQRTTTWTYNQYGLLTQHVISQDGNAQSPDSIVITYTYDTYGNTKTITDAEGNTTQLTYDLVGNPKTKTDPLNRVTTYTYNARSQLEAQTSPMGHTSQVQYDDRGQRVKTTDPLGHFATTTYDKHGRVKTQTDQEGHTTSFEYNSYGDLIKTTSAEGVTNTTSYDSEGRPQTQTDAHNNVITYTYGEKETANADLLISITYPKNLQTLYQYDQRGRRTVSTQKAGSGANIGQELRTITTYDAAGRTVATTSPADKTTTTDYDARDRIIKTTDPDNFSTLYSYDIQDNQVTVTDANQNVHRFQYDKLSRLKEETRPEGGKTTYEYDNASQLKLRTNPDGDTNAIDYDDDGRIIKETKTSHVADAVRKAALSQVVTYSYNDAGQRTGYEQKDGAGQLISQAIYTVDKLGRSQQEKITYGEGATQVTATIGQTWNGDGQKTSQTYPNNTTANFTYDKGYLKTASQPGTSDTITWASYDWNLPTEIQYPGAKRTNSYDGFYRYQQIKTDSTAATQQNILNLAYQYDLDSNITQIQRQVGANIQGTTDYGYDNLDRLTSVQPSQSLQDLGLPTEQYTYDPVHNRKSSAHQPGEWKYETGNRLEQWGYEQSQINYGYSEAGNITEEVHTHASKTRTYEYDASERLTTVKDDNQTIATYQYDPLNRRISKTVGQASTLQTTYFVYNNEGLLAEIRKTGSNQHQAKTYGWEPNAPWGTKLIWQADHAQTPNNTTSSTYHFIQNDHLGTPQIATNRAGQETWSMVAESFGETTVSATASAELNIRFPGQYFDQETNTHYNFHRDYNPAMGRYIESDPIGLDGGLNIYSYSDANGIMIIDPSGLKSVVRCRPVGSPGGEPSWKVRMARALGGEHCYIVLNCENINGIHVSYLGNGMNIIDPSKDSNNDTEYSRIGEFRTLYILEPTPKSCDIDDCRMERCILGEAELLKSKNYRVPGYSAVSGPNSNSVVLRLVSKCQGAVFGDGPPTGWSSGGTGF
ncbi:RHS repeat protein [Lampropedia puyangensis]|uniref:RHS repeat protein n=1 Tax=Lampropedia puyangensis TaxID=1330072 RepID=A0A4S8EMS7_9BURK|nr:RHS repeat-associated core domain-containing protein [Lampropedia puyangensis]THT95972.1 RHS repeat protein [Lampropedia puyangensis]